jgi:HK97 family phage major capsid protein
VVIADIKDSTDGIEEGLGELEIKAESIRHIICAGSDLLQDSSFNIEGWILQKAAQGFHNTINAALLIGDGIGKPLGILHPASSIPICETAPATPLGQFSWADLIMLKWEIPQLWHANGAYIMNQRTFARLLTWRATCRSSGDAAAQSCYAALAPLMMI